MNTGPGSVRGNFSLTKLEYNCENNDQRHEKEQFSFVFNDRNPEGGSLDKVEKYFSQ